MRKALATAVLREKKSRARRKAQSPLSNDIDTSLIEWTLSLSAEERLGVAQDLVDTAFKFRKSRETA